MKLVTITREVQRCRLSHKDITMAYVAVEVLVLSAVAFHLMNNTANSVLASHYVRSLSLP